MTWYKNLIPGGLASEDRRLAAPASRLVTAAAAAILATGVVGGAAAFAAGTAPVNGSGNYSYTTLNDRKDPTFNQLLGINNSGVIAGYFGSGATGHPNRGYTIHGRSFRNENVPGAAQTQVVGLNNHGVTVGFWVNQKGANFGFYRLNGRFHTVNFPTKSNASPQVDQLLGVNDQNVAVGFYTDSKGNSHGFTYSIKRHSFHQVTVPGGSNVTAGGINNLGDVAGFYTTSSGATQAFLKRSNGHVVKLSYPGATMTQAFGVNDGDEVVGTYTDGSGNSATTHGFVWSPGFGFQTVDDPKGIGSTTLNGVNDRGQLVGFYTDSAGNTDGMVATPQN